MVNLFAYRSTDSEVLMKVHDPIGPENALWLKKAWNMGVVTVAAWGNKGKLLGRDYAVRQIMFSLKCLDINKSGQPKHPLYMRGDIRLDELKDYS